VVWSWVTLPTAVSARVTAGLDQIREMFDASVVLFGDLVKL
jgi:hypothetical protein